MSWKEETSERLLTQRPLPLPPYLVKASSIKVNEYVSDTDLNSSPSLLLYVNEKSGSQIVLPEGTDP